MKYYLIVGEASGDLHASNLMRALQQEDSQADFRFFGGDKMSAVGGSRVKHYKELAYMGFIPVSTAATASALSRSTNPARSPASSTLSSRSPAPPWR